MIVTDERVAQFIAGHTGRILCPPYTLMGIERNGAITAGVLFNCFQRHDIHMTAAGAGWTRDFLESVSEYVFAQLGCLRMTAITEQPKVVALALRLGGRIEGRLRSHFGDGRDGFVIGFLKSEWKYNKVRFGPIPERVAA